MALTDDGKAPSPKQHRKAPCKRPAAGTAKADLIATHKAKMARKAQLRAKLYPAAADPSRVAKLLGIPAGINRRTGKPHQHKREIARRLREQASKEN
jgi:hypothetical protein